MPFVFEDRESCDLEGLTTQPVKALLFNEIL